MQRKGAPEPIQIFTAPMTPPDTPQAQQFGSGSWPMQRSSSTSSSGSGSGRRYSYFPTSPPSPLSLPPLMPEGDMDDEESPDMSVGIMTPSSPPKEGESWNQGQRSPPSPQREFRFASHSPLRKSLGFIKEDYFFSAPGMQRSMSLDGIPPHLSRVSLSLFPIHTSEGQMLTGRKSLTSSPTHTTPLPKHSLQPAPTSCESPVECAQQS
jgi:hypothetical protein